MSLQTDLAETLAHLNQGRPKAALKSARAAAKRYKTHPAFPNIAGIALSSLGQPRDAVDQFQKALKLAPEFDDARRNLAQALLVLGETGLAQTLLTRLLTRLPRDGAGWYLQAQAQLAAGQLGAAEDSASQAILHDPHPARARNLRGVIRARAGRLAEAIDDYDAALARAPQDVECLVNAADALSRQGQMPRAMSCLAAALERNPAHQNAWLRLAHLQLANGDLDAARRGFARVLDLAPNHAEALEQLAALNDAPANEALEPRVLAALKSAPRGSEAQAALLFAQARIAAQARRADAEALLARANRTMATLLPANSDADTALSRAALARFPCADAAAGSGPRPVYVLGLPRSGTSLTEAMLGAHPQVAALGERAAAGSLLYPMLEEDSPFDPVMFQARDRALLPPLPPDTAVYVDKMPENYRLAGFLLAADPRARIIHLKRDPRDIALSMWRGHFTGRALAYTYDLDAMARRFNLYAELMAQWHRLYPGRILDLRYEDLVADPLAASQRLATFCTLAWCPEMARPDQAAGQVLTLSASQLRQPVHGRSVGAWRAHADLLEPLIAGLDPRLWPELARAD